MNAKNFRRTVVASIATIAGVFGGMKLYANRKRKQRLGLQNSQE